LSISAGFGIGLKHFLDTTQLSRIRCGNRIFDDSGNLIECDAAFEKRGYRDLVGGIERDRLCPTRLDGFVG